MFRPRPPGSPSSWRRAASQEKPDRASVVVHDVGDDAARPSLLVDGRPGHRAACRLPGDVQQAAVRSAAATARRGGVDGVGVDRDRVDAEAHEVLGEVGPVGRGLPTERRGDARVAAGGDDAPDGVEDGRVGLVEELGAHLASHGPRPARAGSGRWSRWTHRRCPSPRTRGFGRRPTGPPPSPTGAAHAASRAGWRRRPRGTPPTPMPCARTGSSGAGSVSPHARGRAAPARGRRARARGCSGSSRGSRSSGSPRPARTRRRPRDRGTRWCGSRWSGTRPGAARTPRVMRSSEADIRSRNSSRPPRARSSRGCTPPSASVSMNSARSRPTPSTGQGGHVLGVLGDRQVDVEARGQCDRSTPTRRPVSGRRWCGRHRRGDDALEDQTPRPVDRDHLAVAKRGRGRARADDARDTELAGDDRGMARHPAAVGDQRRGTPDRRHPVGTGHRRDEHLAPLQLALPRLGDVRMRTAPVATPGDAASPWSSGRPASIVGRLVGRRQRA